MLRDQFILDHNGMVDRIVAIPAQRREARLERIGNERLHVGRVNLNADGSGELARCQHGAHLLARRNRHHIGRRPVLGHVLVAGEHPGDLAEVDAVLLLQDAARPDAGRDGVAAVDADLSALEILGCADAGLGVHQHGAVVECPHQEDRHRGHGFAVRLGADVGGDRHLADVELVAAHHAAEGGDERIDLFECESEGPGLDGTVLERTVIALRAGDGFQLEIGHEVMAGCFLHLPLSSPQERRTIVPRRLGRSDTGPVNVRER
jgi:hypothetical protein